MKTKTLPVAEAYRLERLPSFHKTGSIAGMKRKFYGRDSLLIRCGSWIYNATSAPDIYHRHAH